MGVEYTENLKLGIQTDKNDFVDWDAITENWKKLDAAYSGMQSGSIDAVGDASVSANGVMQYTAGIEEKGEIE